MKVTVRFDFTLTPSHGGKPAGTGGTTKFNWNIPAPVNAAKAGADVIPKPGTAGEAGTLGRKSKFNWNGCTGFDKSSGELQQLGGVAVLAPMPKSHVASTSPACARL